MNIFCGLHHQSLYTSFQFLFEKRLGHRLFRPIGVEWAPKYWRIAAPYNDDPRTITQFLGIRDEVKRVKPLNEIEEEKEDHYVLKSTPINHKAVTLEQFKDMKFDIIIASIPAHLKPYTELIQKYQPQAKLIFQIGNHFNDVDFSLAKNIMASTSPVGVPTGVNTIFYHQEFDLNVFNYEPPVATRAVRSFVHTLMTAGHFKEDWKDFLAYEQALPEFRFESWGASCREGCAMGEEEVSKLMKLSHFGLNFKSGGDGYGHVLFNFFAVGRPVIIKGSQYKGKLAEKLFTDKTCIDIEKHTFAENVKILKDMPKERHLEMCENAYKIFKENVNFDQEEKDIKRFIENLI